MRIDSSKLLIAFRPSVLIWPLMILLLGMISLLQGSSQLDLWSDEAWSAVVAQQPAPTDAIEMISHDFHPPLYFMELYVWRGMAGEQVLVLRYLSILTTVLAGAVTYRLALLFFGFRAAFLAILFFFLHDLVLVLGQEVRPYPLAQLLTVFTIWQYWRLWLKATIKRGLFFVLSGAALLWTLYWGGFILLALAIHALITRFRKLIPFIVANIIIGLLFLPWMPTVFTMFDRVPQGLNHTLPPTSDGYKILIFQLLGTPEVFWIILVLLGVMVRKQQSWRFKNSSVILVLLVIVTMGISMAINLNYQSLSYRSLSILLPVLVILIANTLSNFHAYEASIVIIIALTMSLTSTSSRPPSRITSFEELVDFITENSTATDIVVSDMQWESMQLAYYLNRHPENPQYRLNIFDIRYIDEARSDFTTYFSNGLSDYDGVWLITLDNYAVHYDIGAILAANNFELTAKLTWHDNFLPIHLSRYDRRLDTAHLTIFGGVMRLEQAHITEHTEGISINLMWSATMQPQHNYTVSAFLLGADGQLVTQHDSYPMNNNSPTITWLPANHYYDSHFMATDELSPGTYQVGVQVYLLTASGQIEPIFPIDCDNNACKIIFLAEISKN